MLKKFHDEKRIRILNKDKIQARTSHIGIWDKEKNHRDWPRLYLKFWYFVHHKLFALLWFFLNMVVKRDLSGLLRWDPRGICRFAHLLTWFGPDEFCLSYWKCEAPSALQRRATPGNSVVPEPGPCPPSLPAALSEQAHFSVFGFPTAVPHRIKPKSSWTITQP